MDAVQQITQLMPLLMSNNNEQRQAAESDLQTNYIRNNPQIGLPALAHILRYNPDAPIRQFAAVLFRRLALLPEVKEGPDGAKAHSTALYAIDDPTREHCKAELLGALASEAVPGTRKKLCDTIAEIAKSLIAHQRPWDELMPTIFTCIQSADPSFRESAFRILTMIPSLLFSGDVIDMPAVSRVFDPSLSDAEIMSVRLVALEAASAFLIEAAIESKAAFQTLMVQMLNVLPKLLQDGDELDLRTALECFIELAMSCPKLFRPILAQLVEFVLVIVGNSELDPATRNTALELMLTLTDEAPQMVRKVAPTFVQRVVPLCLEMMATVEEDEDWYTTDDIDNSAEDDDEPHVVGEQALDRIARKMGAQHVTPAVFAIIPQLLQSADWPHRHAGLLAIAAVAEGCYKAMAKELTNIVNLVLPFAMDPHPRVRYAFCNCIGQLATDFAPAVQRKHHARIIPALIACMRDTTCTRVQAHGAAALVNYCESLDRTHVMPHMPALFEQLGVLILSPKIYVQEQVITTVAVLATAAEADFAPYYANVMPLLMNILTAPDAKETRNLCGKALECATLIAVSVPVELFMPHSQDLMAVAERIQYEATDPEDPRGSFLMHAWARLSKLLGAQFLPYMPVVMPPLLQRAAMQPEMALLQSDEDAAQFPPAEGWTQAVIEGQHLAIRATLLDDKAEALEMLALYAQSLGAGFRPYTASVMQAMVSCIDFLFHDGARRESIASIPQVMATGADIPEVRALWSQALVKLFKWLPEEYDLEFVHHALVAIVDVFTSLGGAMFTQDEVHSLVLVTVKVLTDTIQQVQERERKHEDEDYDPENEEVAETEEWENALLVDIGGILQCLLKAFGADVLPLLEEHAFNSVLVCLRDGDRELRHFGVAVFDDVIEFTGAAAAKYIPTIGEPFLGALAATNQYEVIQSAAYGISVAAQSPAAADFAQLIAAALPLLVAAVTRPTAGDNDEILATENALAAIGHTLRTGVADLLLGSPQQRDEYLGFWVQHMPLVWDDEEAGPATRYLLGLIDQQHPVIAANLRKTIEALLELMYQGTHADASAPGHEGLQDAVVVRARQLFAAIPPAAQAELWAGLEQDKRVELKKYFP
ncbi:armadillo-type protein [Blastocladiella britannica]|nr:armadillo-type protein [Blastocladiella britannica]